MVRFFRRLAACVILADVTVVLIPTPAARADTVREMQYWVGQLGLDQAWAVTKGTGVTVGVVDTGISSDHPDLTGALAPGKAFPELEDGLADSRGHGTAMAVVIAGRGHAGGDGTIGVAPEATVLPAKFTGGPSAVGEAIRWVVDQGARVINLSQGTGYPSSRTTPAAYDGALRYAQEHDVVIVAAAGNSGSDKGVTSPANRPGVVAVTAVDRTGAFRPDVSVQGPEVALAAPGIDIATLASTPAGLREHRESGTSYAAAIVSGVAALVRARFPELNAASVIQRLISTARRPAGAGRDPHYGFGIVDPVRALTESVPVVGDNPLGGAAARPRPVDHQATSSQAGKRGQMGRGRRRMFGITIGMAIVVLGVAIGGVAVKRRRRHGLARLPY
jgi:serine protease